MKNMFMVLMVYSLATQALAAERVEGTFEAVRGCEAYTSFRHGRNPGLIKVMPGHTYEAIEVNAPEWDWVRILIPDPDLAEQRRWVAKECGTSNVVVITDTGAGGGTCSTPNQYDSHVLALTWQPGFCEHYARAGTKPECNAMAAGELVIAHLTLHGLWPNKTSCRRNYSHCSNQALDLSDETIAALAPWMPNFYYSTAFGSYEWQKHGTCQSRDDDTYFLLAKALLEKVDQSEIGQYIKQHIGQTVEMGAFLAHIETKLGANVASKVQLICTQGKYLQELRINLPQNITENADLNIIVTGAPPFEELTIGCGPTIYIERSGVN
jgi:ribonuclease T2